MLALAFTKDRRRGSSSSSSSRSVFPRSGSWVPCIRAMNQPTVYQPDSTLHGLWSPQRVPESRDLRDYLASRPNVCFQCHDLSLLSDIPSVPTEVVVGRASRRGSSEMSAHSRGPPPLEGTAYSRPSAVPYLNSFPAVNAKAAGSAEESREATLPRRNGESLLRLPVGQQTTEALYSPRCLQDEKAAWGRCEGSCPEGAVPNEGASSSAYQRSRHDPYARHNHRTPKEMACRPSSAIGFSSEGRSFPDFVKETIANFVHGSAARGQVQGSAASGRAPGASALQDALESSFSSLESSFSSRPASSAAVGAQRATEQPTIGRTLRGLLSGRDDDRGDRDNDSWDGSGIPTKKARLLLQEEAGQGARLDDSDGPLDLSKRACPSSTCCCTDLPPTALGAPVTLAKKNLHPVTSRVSDCLLRSVQKAARITAALEGVDARDKASLVLSCWHRLLLWLLAEENFSFVVVPAAASGGRSATAQQAQGSFVNSAAAGSKGVVPTLAFVQTVTSFIDKCHSLKLDRVELDLLFSITLFHFDGQHSWKSMLADRLVSETRHRLMDELLRHTAVSAQSKAAGGFERYSQLLLCLPALYAIDVRTFEVLFCGQLTERVVDMRLLLMEIMRPLL